MSRSSEVGYGWLTELLSSVDEPPAEGLPLKLALRPATLGEQDWTLLESGLEQRARLLSELLRDVYGEQTSLKDGLLPPSLLFNNRRWLGPCRGVVDGDATRLLLYAADLVRDTDGWWVVRDYTGVPPGLGWLLDARRWMARAYHELFARGEVEPLAPTLVRARDLLAELNGGERGVVLASPGNAAEFADAAALAHFFGCTLVEGEDLTVRGQQLWLKLLQGLQPVRVLLRRVEDARCDPLELSAGGWSGPSGLIQAVRNGDLVVCNSLGSGWAESPGVAEQLPACSQRLLGETLRLPWRALRKGETVVRCFLAHDGERHRLVPGGLRWPRGDDGMHELWRPARATGGAQPPGGAFTPEAVVLSRGGGDVPSRVASDFFWLGRYLERCEGLLRVARVLLGDPASESRSAELLPGGLAAWVEGRADDQLQTLLGHLKRLGSSLRERLSSDVLSLLAELTERPPEVTSSYLERVSVPVWALVAVARESLYRGHGFRFLEIGRRLERCQATLELLQWTTEEGSSLPLLLDFTDSSRIYARRYPGAPVWLAVVDMLLGDDSQPRSLAYGLRSLGEHFAGLPPRHELSDVSEVAPHGLALARCRELLAGWQPGQGEPPLTALHAALVGLSAQLARVFFTHVAHHRQGAAG